MKTRLVLPKDCVELNAPLIFLMGPISGTLPWQDYAINTILEISKKVYVASPSKRLRTEYLDESIKTGKEFDRQLDWEIFYLRRASDINRKGCILAWLPAQADEMPVQSFTGRPRVYARDTRAELGRWGTGALAYNPNHKIVVGGEAGFDGIDVIKRNFLDVKSDFKFYSSLEETCREAVRVAEN